MNRCLLFLSCWLIGATLPAGVYADTAAAGSTAVAVSTQALTLVELTDLALRRNTQTRLAWAALRASEAGVELARAGYWPQVDAALTVQRNRALNFTGVPADVQTRYGASVSLSYLLWDFGARGGQADQARFGLAAAELSQNQTLQDVILAVEQAYYQVLGLQALAEADRQSLSDADTNLAAVQERRASGLATVGDVYQAEAARAGARLALQQAEGQLAAARGQLAITVGEAPDARLPLAPWNDAGEDTETPALPAQDASELLAQARAARPELLAARAQERAAAAGVNVARSQGLPSLGFDATAGRTHVVDVGTSSQFSALVTLDIPLFAGFGDRAALRQAQAQLETAQATTADLRSQIELEVWQAYQNLRTAVVSLDTTAAQLRSAEQAAEVTHARYRSGLATVLDVLSTQATLATARVQQVQARLDWAAGRAVLGHAVGGLEPTPPVRNQEETP
jgi:TolC family type I secretion outer membrane protein